MKSRQMVQMNLLAKQKYRHRCRRQTLVTKRGRAGRMNWETGIDIHTLLHLKHITNENLLYRTINLMQVAPGPWRQSLPWRGGAWIPSQAWQPGSLKPNKAGCTSFISGVAYQKKPSSHLGMAAWVSPLIYPPARAQSCLTRKAEIKAGDLNGKET